MNSLHFSLERLKPHHRFVAWVKLQIDQNYESFRNTNNVDWCNIQSVIVSSLSAKWCTYINILKGISVPCTDSVGVVDIMNSYDIFKKLTKGIKFDHKRFKDDFRKLGVSFYSYY